MIVYKLTDLTNGKIYVGQTKLTVEERFYFHCYADTHIGHAIREHGKENFLREVLATCEARGEAYALEKRYIAQFDCIIPKGYNATEGGFYIPPGKLSRTDVALSENGVGFMLCYMSNIDSIVSNVKQPSILRVLLHIACHQQYGNDGIFGYRCSKIHLQDTLGIQAATLWSALKWLEENFIIKEKLINGQSDFMISPDYVTIGKEKKKRVKEWNRRCAEYIRQLEAKEAEKAAKESAPANDAQAEVTN